ncbi:MAG: TIGR02453 family protein [Flavobacteriaceae bacterium CG_4_10_14_3_um_filter_33_47]|nr:MAG: TIGR02453 family protein [Flavobacteriaceae bacterium CG_4_10_14_3_um_filter_33_47]PJB16337.1 MAG: TIGR02453 family protein [Flavobacteriaceae bacterium CG_4_9_14_3_um_filter_33_16]
MILTVSEDAFKFLNSLEKNNNREWFNDHKKEFKAIETDIKKIYQAVFENLKKHDDIDKLKMFRIYRDVRFSKNKLPYKTHFGGSFHRTKPHLRGGYYLHIQPNNESFIATGFWEPNKEDLLRMRKEFEMDDQEMRDILNNKSFKQLWGNLVGDELIKAPKGFDKDHKAIDLIRKKQYIFIKKFTDKEVLDSNFIASVDEAFKTVRPYFNYMSDVLTTDLNGVSLI